MLVLKRRRGGLPPIVTALIVIAAVATTGLVAWFMLATTSAAVKQPLLEVTGAYGVGPYLRVAVRNIGTVVAHSLRIEKVGCRNPDGNTFELTQSLTCNPSTVYPGETTSCQVKVGDWKDGAQCVADLVYKNDPNAPEKRVPVSFRVVVP